MTDHIGPTNNAEIKQSLLVPIYLIPESTGDPLTSGDPENFPTLELFQKLRNEPERVFTAAPTPINVQFILEEALETSEHAIVLGLAEWGSATYRAIGQAKEALSADKQARITIINTGYIGSEQAMMTKELLRCAEKGMSVEESLERMWYVESRSYHLWFMASDSVKALAKAGRAKDLGDGSGIADNQMFCRGNMPRINGDPMSEKLPWGKAGEVGEKRPDVILPLGSDPTTLYKPATWVGAVDVAEPGDEPLDAMVVRLFDRVKAACGETRVLRDCVVNSIGRPDLAYKLAAKIKAELPVNPSEVSVCDPPALMAAAFGWGDRQITFWLDEGTITKTESAEGLTTTTTVVEGGKLVTNTTHGDGSVTSTTTDA